MRSAICFAILFSGILGLAQNKNGFIAEYIPQDSSETKIRVAYRPEAEIPMEGLGDVLNSIPETDNLVISTDSTETTERIAENLSRHPRKKNPLFMFFGKILKNNPLTRLASDLKEEIRQDPTQIIYLSVVAITTARDSIVWLNLSSMPAEQRYFMISFNCLITSVFLIKDLWAKMVDPLDKKIQSTFNYLRLNRLIGKSATELTSNYFANLPFATALQITRMGIISFDDIFNSIQTVDFWALPTAIALAMSSSFAWSKQSLAVKAQENPVTKWTINRVTELRTLIIGMIAPSSYLYNYQAHGLGPWVIQVVSGGVGILSYLSTEKIKEKFESSKILRSGYQRTENAAKFISSFLQGNAPMQCIEILQ